MLQSDEPLIWTSQLMQVAEDEVKEHISDLIVWIVLFSRLKLSSVDFNAALSCATFAFLRSIAQLPVIVLSALR